MDSDQGKLFIGGISWETTEDRLKEHFGNYGEVLQVVIMRDKLTGRPRGFGFVVFADPNILDRVLTDKHTIDGRTVEAKRALSREEQHTSARPGNPNTGRAVGGGGGGGNVRTKKIFVGGLPPTLTEDEFRQYFSDFGNVTDVVVMYDQSTNRPRGFGFISFDNEDAVDNVLMKTFHDLKGKLVEVKRALPKELNPNSGGNRAAGGGNYQSYGSSGVSAGSYDGRTDTNRFMQSQTAGGGYQPYGSSGYASSGYGYAGANNGTGYGGYGVSSGYGNSAAGYGGPTGAYGNPNPSAAGYVSGPPGAPRSPWTNQTPTGYGSAGYGANAGYGAATGWNAQASSGGAGAAPTGQSPSGAAGYGNQGYGYGGYGGTDGSYGNQGGYGAVGGRGGSGPPSNQTVGTEQGVPSGYMGGSYGDASGGTGYPNTWRSDPSQGAGYGASQINGPPGGPAGYGGGYGGQPRQVQQQ